MYPRAASEILVAAQGGVTAACGPPSEASSLCETVYRLTNDEAVARAADVIIAKPAKIAFILLSAFVATRVLRRVIKRLVRRLQSEGVQERWSTVAERSPLVDTGDVLSPRRIQRADAIGQLLRSLTSLTIWTIAILMVFGELGINLGPLIAGAGIIGIALGFGAQSLVRDFLSGVFMLVEDQYGVGDVVDVGAATGVIEAVSLRSTRIRGLDGTLWHVPNGEIHRVGNMSQHWSRVVLDVGVAYDTELEEAIEIIRTAAHELSTEEEYRGVILEDPEVWGVEALGDSAIAIRLVVKTLPLERWNVARALRLRVKGALDDAGITIPFPQRTVWMHHADGEPARPRQRKR